MREKTKQNTHTQNHKTTPLVKPRKTKPNPNPTQEFWHWLKAQPFLPSRRSLTCLKALPNWGTLITSWCFRRSSNLILLLSSAEQGANGCCPQADRRGGRARRGAGADLKNPSVPWSALEAVGCQMQIGRVFRNLWFMTSLTKQELITRRQFLRLPFQACF